MRDPFKQFDDLFKNDPFFHDAFRDMDDVFARRFDNDSSRQPDQERDDADADGGVGPLGFFCGVESPARNSGRNSSATAAGNNSGKKASWPEWIMNKLGIELSVTSIQHNADGTVEASAYTSKPSGTYSKKTSRTYVRDGRQVSVMTMEKDGGYRNQNRTACTVSSLRYCAFRVLTEKYSFPSAEKR